VKRAFNIAVNADTEAAAVRAIAQEIGGKGAHAKARDLLDAIKARHRPIAPCFGSGAGLRLQRRDADLAERVLLRLLDQGIVALPIHDSFIVRRHHADACDEAMDAELGKLLAALGTAKCVSLRNAYLCQPLARTWDQIMEDWRVAGLLVVVLPPCPSRVRVSLLPPRSPWLSWPGLTSSRAGWRPSWSRRTTSSAGAEVSHPR